MLRFLFPLLFLGLGSSSASAQTPATDSPARSPFTNSPVYVDLQLGLGGGLYGTCGLATGSAGYRFSPAHALGVEWRGLSGSNGYNGLNVQGFGLRYRHQRGRLIGQVAAGKITGASRYTDFYDEWEFTGRGRYLSTGVDYQFRWGGTVGLHFAHVAAQLDHYQLGDGTIDELEFAGVDLERSGALTLAIGYAFPRATKRPTPPPTAAYLNSKFVTSPIYADVAVGFGLGSYGWANLVTASAGYRFDPAHALGLEWRRSGSRDDYQGFASDGLGLRYRHQSGQFIAQASGGPVVSTRRHIDWYDEWEYTGTGYYLNAGAGYQFRWGGTVELHIGHTNAQLDHYEPGDINPEDLRYAGVETERAMVVTLAVGYAFPRQPRRK